MAARLGKVCQQARIDAGIHAITVAQAAGISEASLSRFEHGLRGNGRPGFSPQADLIVEAYAHETGLDPLELWRRAIDNA